MRKYLIGAFVGFSLSFAVTAHAAVENLIGRVVEGVFPVKVNGVQIEKQAIVIDGTSYLPVRAIGDALGLEVTFDADLGIGLTQKKAGEAMTVVEQTSEIKPQRFEKVRTEVGKTVSKTGEYGLIEIDGNQYVNLVAISGPYTITWNKPVANLKSEDGNELNITVNDSYSINTDAFVLNGEVYVKLTAIGLKATVQGDTLVIEQQ